MEKSNSDDLKKSPLFQRFNGIMLGFFSQMSSFNAVQEQWPVLQVQMSRFVSEIHLDVLIPQQAIDFIKHRSDITGAVMDLDDSLSVFKAAYGLGYAFVGIVDGTEIMERSLYEKGMSALSLDPSEIDELISNISRDKQGRIDFNEMMTKGLKLTAKLIADCKPEPKTCFVAMPFREPYPVYYDEVYRELLEANGFRCVRGWGSMRNEAYHDMLLMLIDRCGWVFADLTDSNPNVAYELGFAIGRNKHTLVVMDTNPDMWVNWRVPGQPKKLGNLQGIVVLPYDSSDPTWPENFLNGLVSVNVEGLTKGYAESGTMIGRIKSWLQGKMG